MRTIIDNNSGTWVVLFINRPRRPRVIATNVHTGIALTELDDYFGVSEILAEEFWPEFARGNPRKTQTERLF